MTNNTKLVLSGWFELSEEQRREFQEEIRKYNRKAFIEKRKFRESVGKINLGPLLTSGVCPCCGR